MNWPPRMHLDQRSARGLGLNLPPVHPPPQAPPVLRPDASHAPPPSPMEGQGTYWGCNAAQRVQLAGGALNTLLVHPEIIPFEQLYRKLPEEGMFLPNVSPETPFAFELGAFRVPQQFALLLFDLRPDIYRLSGIDPGDTVPVEARRFSSVMGFEITVDQRHVGNTRFEIDPQAISATQEAFSGPQNFQTQFIGDGISIDTPIAAFDNVAASSFASAAGAGLSLLPQRPTRYGATSIPFTLYVRAGQVVQVRAVVFRPVPSPVAFIEYDIAGLLVPGVWIDAINECMKPMTHASGGPGSVGGGPR